MTLDTNASEARPPSAANAIAFALVSRVRRAGEVHSYRLSGDAPSQAHTPLFFVHGVSYIDEHLAMIPTATNVAYYYVQDRMYNP